jgi:hypothetical protein
MSQERLIQIGELGVPCPIALPRRDIARLANGWGRAEDWDAWANIVTLADEFLAVSDTTNQTNSRRWHDLVMAVGNYKRQTGRIKAPRFASPDPIARRPNPPDQFAIPGNGATLIRDDPESWVRLTSQKKGFGVPMATTLMSALWPDHHFILDRRDVRAAVGLGPATKWSDTDSDLDQNGNFPEEFGWDWYFWLRDCVNLTKGSTLLEVERALFVLDERVAPVLKKAQKAQSWAWHEYSTLATAAGQHTRDEIRRRLRAAGGSSGGTIDQRGSLLAAL